MNFGFKLFLFVGHQVDLDVRVGRAGHVHTRQVSSLDDSHRQLKKKIRDFVFSGFN